MSEDRQAVVFDGHELPPTWTVGGFELDIAELTSGRLDEAAAVFRGVAGPEVLHPQTEISFAEAQELRPGVALGDTIPLDLAVEHADLQKIVELGRGVRDWLDSDPPARSRGRRRGGTSTSSSAGMTARRSRPAGCRSGAFPLAGPCEWRRRTGSDSPAHRWTRHWPSY